MTTITSTHGTRFRPFEQTIEFHRVDERMFNRTRDDAPVIDETGDRVAPLCQMARPLATSWQFDTFNALTKHKPVLTGHGDPLVTEMLNRVRKDERYEELRTYTVGDDMAAGLASCALVEAVARAYPEELKKKAKAARDAEDEARAAEEAAKAAAEDPETSTEDAQQARESADDAKHAAAAKRAVLQGAIRGYGKQTAQVVAKAVAEAKDLAEATATAVRCFSFGTGTQAASGGLDPREKLRMAELVRKSGPAFRKLVTLLGRLSSEAIAKQASKTKHSAGAVTDVTLGSDVSNMLEDELVQLMRPKLRPAMLAKLADDSAMMYEVENKEPKAKGPVVVLADESGSMQGQPEAEMKAIALALAHVCAKQKRVFVMHFFQSDVTHTVRIDPKDTSASEAGVNVALRKLGEIAGRGTGGGTSFDRPLMRAVATVTESEVMREADVLMITDGICNVADATLAAVNDLRAKTGAKVYSMLIGSGPVDTLAKFSDKVWSAASLLGPAGELFEMV